MVGVILQELRVLCFADHKAGAEYQSTALLLYFYIVRRYSVRISYLLVAWRVPTLALIEGSFASPRRNLVQRC